MKQETLSIMKKYILPLMLLLTLVPVCVSCNNDDLDFVSNQDLEMVGQMGSSEDCKLVMPSNAALKNPFDEKFSYFCENDKLNGTPVSSLSAMRNAQDISKLDGLEFYAILEPVIWDMLRPGDQLSPTSVHLGIMYSSNSSDDMRMSKGGKIYVRSISADHIVVYLDHLVFTCQGTGYLDKGDYTLYGDLKLPKYISKK